MTLEELTRQLQTILPELRQRYAVHDLWLFGSYVRDEERPDSNLDLLIDFVEPPTLFEFVRLQNQLSELLGVRVDLVMKSVLKPKIGKQILSEIVAV
jgi:predicted nucleotidyltransferase